MQTVSSDPVLQPFAQGPGYTQWQVGPFAGPRDVQVTSSAGGGSASITIPLIKPSLESVRFVYLGSDVTQAAPGTSLTCTPEFALPVPVVGQGFDDGATITSSRPDLIAPVSAIDFRFRTYDISNSFSCAVATDANVTEPTPVSVSVTYLGVTRSATVTVMPPGGP